MALPTVKSLADCVDFERTVSAFIPQLYALPPRTLNTLSDSQSLKDLYTSTNPFISALALSLFLAPIFLLASEATRNYSQVDRLWSILPMVYHLHYAVYARLVGQPPARTDLVLAVTVIWGARLTANYYRRGGYEWGSEDYRWEVVKNYLGQPWFLIFNVVFISLIQMLLLLSLTTPAYILFLSARVDGALSSVDWAYAAGIVACVAVEGISDQQQWNFHRAKHQYQKTAKVPPGYAQADLDRGFNATGLWRYSRHPNFTAEQAVWIVLYLWSCQVTGTSWNWSVVGSCIVLLLFQASTWLTELLTARKYPHYTEHQKKVGMFVPSPLPAWPSKTYDQVDLKKRN